MGGTPWKLPLDSKASLGISSSSLLLPTSKLDEVDQSRHDMDIHAENIYLVVSTHLKNISQFGSFLQFSG